MSKEPVTVGAQIASLLNLIFPTLGVVSVYGDVLEMNEKTYFIFVKYWVLSIE